MTTPERWRAYNDDLAAQVRADVARVMVERDEDGEVLRFVDHGPVPQKPEPMSECVDCHGELVHLPVCARCGVDLPDSDRSSGA